MHLHNYQAIYPSIMDPLKDQSVENAGVAFVKGATERNEFFETKQTVMYDEQAWTNNEKD